MSVDENEKFMNDVRDLLATASRSDSDMLLKYEILTKILDTVLRLKNNPNIVALQNNAFRRVLWDKLLVLGDDPNYSGLRVWNYMRQIFPENEVPDYIYNSLEDEGYSIEMLFLLEREECSLERLERECRVD